MGKIFTCIFIGLMLAVGLVAIANASHVTPGEMITAAQNCMTVEEARMAQELFSNSGNKEGAVAYFEFINSGENECQDTRVWGITPSGFLPVSKVDGEPVRTAPYPFAPNQEEVTYTMWEFWWDGDTVYVWEIHPIGPSI